VGPTLRLAVAVAAACLAFTTGCRGGKLQKDAGSGGIDIGGAAGPGGAGGPGGAAAPGGGVGAMAGSIGGAGGSQPPPPQPCLGPGDPRLVVASQRMILLPSTELINMIRVLTDDTEARAIVEDAIFPVVSDLQRRFPPSRTEQYKQIVDTSAMVPFTNVARHAAKYVFDNFGAMTGCSPATDPCAQAYLDAFSERAYRRPLDGHEQGDLTAHYDMARETESPEEATRDVVAAILVAPPFLYRSELGDPERTSSSPFGIPLKPYELASALSFFLTDGPPDQPLLDAARAGTLSATLDMHVDRLLATPAARAWLTKMVEALFQLNVLPATAIDPTTVPEATAALFADMQTEAHLFLDDTLWNGKLTDLLSSRETFLNATLATVLYKVPVPPGATATTFVAATLPMDQRSGLLTNAGFLTTRSRSSGIDLVTRGLGINGMLLARVVPAPSADPAATNAELAAARLLDSQTVQQQVAYRAARPACAACHAHFDPYGAALDNYDIIGRYRTVGDNGQKVDAHAMLPPELGSVPVANAIELATVMAQGTAFKQGLAASMLGYALYDAWVDVPDPAVGAAGCAAMDVVRAYDDGSAKTFSGLLRAIALSPTFSLRSRAVP